MMAAEAFGRTTPERLNGAVIIEWPESATSHDWPGTLDGRHVTIRDAGTETLIRTVTGVTIHADLRGNVDAEMTLYTSLDGTPLLNLEQRPVADGKIRTGTFRVRVAAMRVRQ